MPDLIGEQKRNEPIRDLMNVPGKVGNSFKLLKIAGFTGGAALATVAIFYCANIGTPKRLYFGTGNSNLQMVYFDPSSINFGKLLQNQTLSHEFKLINRTTDDQRVVAVNVSCSCTLVSTNIIGAVVRPGGETNFSVTFKTGSHSGRRTSTIDVALQSRKGRSVAQGTVVGTVAADFSYSPIAVDFGLLGVGVESKQVVVFRPDELSEFELVVTQQTLGPFEAFIDKREVRVTFHAPIVSQSETFHRLLRIDTSSQRVPEVSVPLTAQVMPDVEVVPAVIVLGPGAAPTSRFTIRTSMPSRLTRVRTQHRGIGTTLQTSNIWSQAHTFNLAHESVKGEDQIDFELDIRNSAGRIETRLASAQVKSLVIPEERSQ